MPLGTTLFVHELEAVSVPYELIHHEPTFSAYAEAEALGLEPSQVAKTIVVETPAGFVRAVLPASERLDVSKTKDALGINAAELATEKHLAGAFPEFELGAVPPLGGPPDRVIVDSRVVTKDSIVLEAGAHSESIRVRPVDLVAATRAVVADICAD
jgi:prolyl-tRNA editing enzyme YbaK/EbsC (Cys-tRNA(Pro) deacylase)